LFVAALSLNVFKDIGTRNFTIIIIGLPISQKLTYSLKICLPEGQSCSNIATRLTILHVLYGVSN